jgi:hypothetical protein
MPEIPALRRLRQEDSELEGSLGYTVRPCLTKKKDLVPILPSNNIFRAYINYK